MAEMNTVVEGKVKFREGKKWKPRWCVMKKPSPVADRLLVLLYKDVKDSLKGGNPKSKFPLDGFYGLESGICYDRETSVLAIICHKQITLLAFESRENLIQFEIKIRRSLGEEHQFPVRIVKVPPQSKLPLDLVRMHIHGQKFCLTSLIPPKILMSWQISDLRRFGMVDGKFCFEGGSRCGKGTGVHVLATDQAKDVADILNLASLGKTPSCRRQSTKRRSEYLEPVKNVVNDNTCFKNFQNTQVYADQNFQDDTSWPTQKRHSISFMDYRRAKSYADKNRLMSIENVEKERLMAIYDIPPRRIRKVETVANQKEKSKEQTHSDSARSDLPGEKNNSGWPGEYNNNVMSYQVPSCESETGLRDRVLASAGVGASPPSDTCSLGSRMSLNSNGISTNLVGMPMSCSAPALCGYGSMSYTDSYQQYSQSVPHRIDEEIDRVVGVSRREDALEKLQREEVDLQREMSLLDEILEVCKMDETPKVQRLPKFAVDTDRLQPPPLPAKMGGIKRVDSDRRPSDKSHNLPPSPEGSGRFSSGYSDSALLSPNLVSKLKKIPAKSRLLAPLPYVNLDKYDVGDVGVDHVHLSAVSTSAPVASQTWSGSQNSKSKGYDNVKGDDPVSENKENKRISQSLPGSRENLRQRSGSDSGVNARQGSKSNLQQTAIREPIYANEPIRMETPPPELPPKGPALLNKSRQQQQHMSSASSRPPPRPPERKHSLQTQVTSDRYGMQYNGPRQGVKPITSRNFYPEDTYFVMSGFQKEPQNTEKDLGHQDSVEDIIGNRPVIKLPPRSLSSQLYKDDCGGGYMEMAKHFEMERSVSSSVIGYSSDSVCSSYEFGARSHSQAVRPKYNRSLSASGVADFSSNDASQTKVDRSLRPEPASAGNSPEVRRKEPIRDTNYVLMSGVLGPQKSVLEKLQSLHSYVSITPAGNSATKVQDVQAVEEEQNTSASANVSETKQVDFQESVLEQIAEDEQEESKPELPFRNLMEFQLQSASMKPNKSLACVSSEKSLSESPGKSGGFFSRLIRRNSNSKDRKSMSQSQENLLGPTCVDVSVIERSSSTRECTVFPLDVDTSGSSSSESSRAPSHQELAELSQDRARSSSFPNRSSYISTSDNSDQSSSSTGISILSQQSDLGAVNSSLTASDTMSTYTSSSDGKDHLESKENICEPPSVEEEVKTELMGSYDKHSFFFVGPLTSCEKDTRETPKEKNADEDCIETSLIHGTQEDEEKDDDKCKLLPNRHVETKVFTVLHVQQPQFEYSKEGYSDECSKGDDCSKSDSDCSSKTDDEKLIELWESRGMKESNIAELKSRLSLPLELDESMSPDQKASAIARHISSLPPFVPPKMKNYHSSTLSPVYEILPKRSWYDSDSSNVEGEPKGDNSVSESEDSSAVSGPALKKQQAKATLRITPPSEDENGKIWIPRSSVREESPVPSTKSSSLVVDVSDVGDADALSISSLDSSMHGEETVRSSPASTILRPRSGREYQTVERRRTTDSCGTSPLNTPQSPAEGSVFTFESVSGPSSLSSQYSRDFELHSPKLAKVSELKQAQVVESVQSPVSSIQSPVTYLQSPSVSYMNTQSVDQSLIESIYSPRALYMNVNKMTPPASPLQSTTSTFFPAEQLEPQLNYAEIDLSESARVEPPPLLKTQKSLKSIKSQRSIKSQEVPTEYAMIDLVATVAVEKAGKEHAILRDSLRRDRKISSSSGSVRERGESLSLPPHPRLERKQSTQSAVAQVGQSTSSVDSTTF